MKKKTIIILSISILTVLIIFIGSSYALFSKTQSALNKNEYQTGVLQIEYSSDSTLTINPIPMTDANGEALTPYIFTITNTGTLDYQYDLKLLTDSTYVASHGCANNQTPAQYIKVKLDDSEPVLLSNLTSGTIISDETLAAGASKTYNLRMWLDISSPNSIIGSHFHGKIVSEGEAIYTELNKPNAPVLASGMIPIKYDGTKWVKAESTNTNDDWYNYDNKMWANAVMVKPDVTEYYLDDLSSNNYDAKLMNGAKVVTIDGEKAIELDGVDDYIEVPVLPSTINWTGGYSVEVTMKWKSVGSYARIMDFGNGAGSDNLVIARWGTTDYPYLGYYNGSTNTIYPYTSISFTLDTKEKYKFELISGDSYYTLKMYLNDVLKITSSDTISSTAFVNVTRQNNYIGKSNWDNPYLDAYIYDFKILDSTGTPIISYDADNVNVVNTTTRSYYASAEVGTEVKEEDILAYYVWIPRYRYQLFNVDSTTMDPIEIQMKFEDKDATKSNGTANGQWLTHPAFTFGTNELKGIWVGKFSTTGSAETPTIKPNIGMLTNQNVSTQFTTSQKFGTTTYLTSTGVSEVDAHMMKNIEWGAVAYLKQSKYGLGTTDIGVNNYNSSPYLTGCGSTAGSEYSTTCNAYNTTDGMLASTTGNVYGVYDMSAYTGTYVMGVMQDNTGTNTPMSGYSSSSPSGFTGKIYDSGNFTDFTGTPFPNTKYYDLYAYSTSYSDYTRRILGDATGEVASWYDDYSGFVSSGYPWVVRGGGFNGHPTHAGVFTFIRSYGGTHSKLAFRSVLAPGA